MNLINVKKENENIEELDFSIFLNFLTENVYSYFNSIINTKEEIKYILLYNFFNNAKIEYIAEYLIHNNINSLFLFEINLIRNLNLDNVIKVKKSKDELLYQKKYFDNDYYAHEINKKTFENLHILFDKKIIKDIYNFEDKFLNKLASLDVDSIKLLNKKNVITKLFKILNIQEKFILKIKLFNKVSKVNLTTEDYLNILETLFETDIHNYLTNEDIKLLFKKSIINLIIKSEDYEILLLKFITLWQNNNRGIMQ